jgi:hypothetical protein
MFLSRFVADAVAYMAQSPDNTVVLRCSDGFRRCCIMASALLLQLRVLSPSIDSDALHMHALNFYYEKRGSPLANEQFLGPSQIRFLKFFSDCLNADIVTPTVSPPTSAYATLMINRIAGHCTSICQRAHR